MIDPKVMNKITEEMAANGEILQPKYNKSMDDLSAYEEFVPPDNLNLKVSNDEDYNYDNKPQNPEPQYQSGNSQFREHQMVNGYKESERPEMPYDNNDDIVFPGGPLKSELESWKKQYTDIWIVDDLPTDQIYVYRDLNRYEYKAIMATPNTDPLMREEIICEQCVLFPHDFSYQEMSESKAGVVTVLAQHIMETSGFTKASIPRRL